MNLKRTFLFLLCFVLIAGATHAQRLTGTIRGTVIDESGQALPGVTVTLIGEALIGGAQTSSTEADGGYRFPALPPGSYKVSFSLEGFQTIVHDQVRVVLGTTIEENVTLYLSKISEEMIITGETPTIDPTKPGFSTNYTQEYIENTPTTRFSFFDFVQMAPGASPMRFDNSAFSHSILGSNTNENMYQMDGIDLTSATTGAAWPFPSTDIIEEIEILDIGAPAEYGNYAGAVVNVVTKSGGNQFHGDANFYWQTEALTGENAEIDGIPFHRSKYVDGSAQIGGPILKDKLWFYGGWQSRREHFSEPGTPEDSPVKEDDDRYFFKFTYDLNQQNKIVGGLHNDYYSIPFPVSITQPIETVLKETGNNPTPNVMWTSVLNDKTFLEVRYAGFYGKDIGEPQNGVYASGHSDLYTGYYSQGILSWYDGDLWKSQVSGKVSYYAEDFLKGDHDFRFGVQYTNAGSDYIYAYTNGVKYYDYDGAPYLAYFQSPYHIGANINSIGMFADDTWQLSDSLTLSLGLRFDHSTGNIPDYPLLDSAGNDTGTTIPGLGKVATWDVVSPRIGFTYQFPFKKATQIRGHYGRYYAGMLTTYLQFAGPARSRIDSFLFNEETGQYDEPVFSLDPASQVGIDPDLKNPYTDQFAIGFDRELTTGMAIGASFIYKRGEDYIGWLNTVGQYEEVPFFDPVTGNTINVFNQINDPLTDNFFLITNPDFFFSRYKGFLVSLTKRMTDKWTMSGSLTISKTEGFHAGSSLGPSDDQDASFFQGSNQQYGQDPNDYINGEGLLNGDRTYIFKMQGTYDLPWDMSVSGNYSLMTGRPYAATLTVTGLNQGAKDIFLESRDGSRRTSTVNLLDLRLGKTFYLGESFKIAVAMDILNVFNDDAFYDVGSTLFDSPVFGVGSIFVPPRRLMLSGKFGF